MVKYEEKSNYFEFSEKDPLSEKQYDIERDFSSNLKYGLKNIKLEPVILLFTSCAILTSNTTQNLCLQKICRVNLNYSTDICDSLKLQSLDLQNPYERNVQLILGNAIAWKTYIVTTWPSLMGLLVGPYSDKTGNRRIFLLMPLACQILMCIASIINTFFFNELSIEALIFSDAILDAIAGSWYVLLVSAFSYVADRSTLESRTFRIGLIQFCAQVGFPIGMGLSGILLKRFGYYGCYAISGSIQCANLIYGFQIIKDYKTTEHKLHDKKGVVYFLRTFFDLSNVKESVAVVFKNDPKTRRLRMIILLSMVTILFGPMYGEIWVMYMMTRYRFNWDEVKFSLFQAYNFIIHTVGTIFSITVFSKYLQWHDSLLGIISTVSKIAASFVYCFAPTPQIFFIAPAVEILNGTALLALRSIVSKLVAPNELGRVNSIFGLTENLMPLVYVPLYTQVYNATMEVLPGAVFLMGAAMTVPAVIVFVCLFVEHRLGLKKKIKNAVTLAEMPLTT
ncbi:hypothetical protein ACJJTC_004430 [Scirpophaga incertulas]